MVLALFFRGCNLPLLRYSKMQISPHFVGTKLQLFYNY